jgi:membrane protease YdiL (CAAX protease family)
MMHKSSSIVTAEALLPACFVLEFRCFQILFRLKNVMTIRGWKPLQQILLLLAVVSIFALLWLLILTRFSSFSYAEFFQAHTLPVLWQRITLTGFYLGMWGVLCLFRYYRRESFSDWGLRKPFLQSQSVGFLCGVCVLVCLRVSESPLEGLKICIQLTKVLRLSDLMAALLLSMLEEMLFRGLILQILMESGHRLALVLQGILFAAVHGESWQYPVLALNLFLIACLLGKLRLKTGHLGWSIGLHAGWIWAVLSLNRAGLMTMHGFPWNPLQAIETIPIFLWLLLILTNDARIPSMS